MKKTNFTGWKDVFKFTLVQNFKSKASIITTIIFFVIALVSLPLMSLINGTDSVKPSAIKKVIIINEAGIDINSSIEYVIGQNEEYKDIKYEVSQLSKEEEEKALESEENHSNMLMIFSYDENMGFEAEFKYGKETKIDMEEAGEFSYYFEENFQMIMANAAGISEEQLEAVNKRVETEVVNYNLDDIKGTQEDTNEMDLEQYGVLLVIITVMTLLISLTGESVAGAIVTEKSSKIVELLLTSIRPMAIITGKVLAMFTTTVIELLVLAAGMGASFLLNGYINGDMSANSIPTNLKGVLSSDILKGLNVGNIIIAVILLFAGMLFYGIFAGLVGLTVNKLEEMAEGMKLYTFSMMIGAYIGIGIAIACMSGGCPDIAIILACVFPLSAPFCLPGFIVLGELSLLISIISVVLMVLSIVILTIFTANVYEEVIYHNGEKLKIKDLFKIYKKNRREASGNE